MDINVSNFFAPVSFDLIDSIIAKYEHEKKTIINISEIMLGQELSHVFSHFVQGNTDERSIYRSISASHLFGQDGALKALNGSYWDSILTLTDVRKLMPQKRREEWAEQIEKHQTPEFTQENVRATVNSLLNSRAQFISEKVDGIFQSLSKEHVTNCPEGFYKRMIMAGMFHGNDTPDYKQRGYIDDLRDVVGRIMKRGEYEYGTTTTILSHAYKNSGKWHMLDGNAIRIKAFKKGTIHLEIHPDIALELNIILSYMHPTAIPSKNRERKTMPANKNKDFQLNMNMLSFQVLSTINKLERPPLKRNENGRFREYRGWTDNENSVRFPYNIEHNNIKPVEDILYFLGGVRHNINQAVWYEFDYNIHEIIKGIVNMGCLPDVKSYQYYPTPESLAEEAVAWADIDEDNHSCLEPSAGQGGIAKFMNPDNTTCVEISSLNSSILKEKGYKAVYEEDFISWADKTSERFDRIVMNPPFSEGRAELHTQMAFSLLKPDGVLVAVLPASFKNKEIIKGKNHEYSRVYSDLFCGTSVSVIIVKINY